VTEQERLAAALAYQQAQQPARMNPNLAVQGARGRENMMPPTSIMDERYPAFKRNQEDVEKLMLGLDIVGSAIPLAGPAMKGAKILGQAAAPQIAQALENYTFKTGMALPMVERQAGRTFAAPQDEALRLAQERAAQQGQSADPYARSLQQGFEHGWYHGTTGDITNFRPDLLGEATGAASARKGFFFARDPQNPPAAMLQKTTDQASIDMLKKMGISDEKIAELNTVSMQGHGAETASGYAQIGGSREYREATRKAQAAERRRDWKEYEKQSQIAEDAEINRMNYVQSLTAKHGDARDAMLDTIQKTVFNKTLPQAEAVLLDEKYKQLFPSGWYNFYNEAQFDNAKKQLVNMLGEKAAKPALQQIDKYRSISNERRLAEHTQEGSNVMPVALSYKNPLVHDFGGSSYREQTYSDLVDKALAGKHDALILKNTFDPGGSAAKLIDVGVMFSPEQIRSRFAAFDPLRRNAAIAAAMGVAAPDLLAKEKKK
jgi:hypothetical protein